jgi:hypothetical protein
MHGNGEQDHLVKRLTLPSGKSIEVVYFRRPDKEPAEEESGGAAVESREAPAARSPASRELSPASSEQERDLHVCRDCGSELVHPLEWEESGPEHWLVTLSCPNCGAAREGVFSQAAVEVFDEELDRGSDALAQDYRLLVRANMADEIDRFTRALAADAILPTDF